MREIFLDHGFVELVDSMGDDYRILQSARVSTGGVAKKGDKEDRGLIRYLYKNDHLSPFEQVMFTFHCKLPNFVMKQYLRHRTFSTNEYSQRYSKVDSDYYVPKEWRVQGITNHQGSGEVIPQFGQGDYTIPYIEAIEEIQSLYERMLQDNVAKEMARIVLPTSMYTEFYFTADLRNLLHFLELRLHEHAQLEIQVFAQGILNILKNLNTLNWSMEIFEEMTELNWKIKEMLSSKIEPTSITKYLSHYIK